MKIYKVIIAVFILLQHGYTYSQSEFRSYPIFGVTLGLGPLVGYNLVAGYSWERIGFHTTGMYRSDNLSCIQGNIFYKVFENRIWMHSFGVIGGKGYAPADENNDVLDYSFAGVSYNLSAYSAFLEIGLTRMFDKGDEEMLDIFPYPSFQIGLVHRFY